MSCYLFAKPISDIILYSLFVFVILHRKLLLGNSQKTTAAVKYIKNTEQVPILQYGVGIKGDTI